MVRYELRHRFINDPIFKRIVDMIVATSLEHGVKIDDFRDALDVAEEKLQWLKLKQEYEKRGT